MFVVFFLIHYLNCSSLTLRPVLSLPVSNSCLFYLVAFQWGERSYQRTTLVVWPSSLITTDYTTHYKAKGSTLRNPTHDGMRPVSIIAKEYYILRSILRTSYIISTSLLKRTSTRNRLSKSVLWLRRKKKMSGISCQTPEYQSLLPEDSSLKVKSTHHKESPCQT